MQAGRIVTIIGGILGILSVVLFYILPNVFCFWQLGGSGNSYYLGGFGFWDSKFFNPSYSEDILLLIICLLVFIGGVLAVVGGLTKKRVVGVLGGVSMLCGPILLSIALMIETGDFEILAALVDAAGGGHLLFGTGFGLIWGIFVSTYIAIGAGVLGVIGGIKT